MARVGYTHAGTRRDLERCAARNRRRLVRAGALLLPGEFCLRKDISREELVRQERRGDIFSVEIEGRTYFPAVLADKSFGKRRLATLLRLLRPSVPPMARYLLLVSRRGSLGDKTPLQATRRGKRYRVALRLADDLVNDSRISECDDA